MSDFSLLHKKYTSVSNLTNELNNSVIVLKRRNMVSKKDVLETHPKLQVQDEDVQKAYRDIGEILGTLEKFYNDRDTHSDLYELLDNPLFKKHILDSVEYRENMLTSLKKINAEEQLNNSELSRIDKFISILDNEASVLYRKLRSTRG